MRWYEITEYKTKSGDEIVVKSNEDIEGDENRGWIVDKFSAYVNGDYAGYLKISYIPEDRFKKHYPTILSFMHKVGGSYLLPPNKASYDYKDLSTEELKDVVKSLAYHSSKYYQMWNRGEGIPETRNKLLAVINDIIKNDLEKQKKDFKRFYNYFVDKPIVDYIRVFKQGEKRYDRSMRHDKEEIHPSEKNYQRQHIATALYLEVAKWLKKKGLKLYASDTQSPEAVNAWEHLQAMGHVDSDGKRRWIEI